MRRLQGRHQPPKNRESGCLKGRLLPPPNAIANAGKTDEHHGPSGWFRNRTSGKAHVGDDRALRRHLQSLKIERDAVRSEAEPASVKTRDVRRTEKHPNNVAIGQVSDFHAVE